MSLRNRGVCISAMGIVSPLGLSPSEMVEALLAGDSALCDLPGVEETPFTCRIGATVQGFKARDYIANRKNLKLMSTAVRLGMGALHLAWQSSGLNQHVDPERLGIFVGSGTAVGRTEDLVPAIEKCFTGDEFQAARFGEEGMGAINPLWLLKGLSNNVLGFGTAELDARGINQNYCNSGVGGLQAIGEAAWAIAEGRADAIIAGASDSATGPLHLTGFGRLGALTRAEKKDDVRPFDQSHDGFAPAEGAAFMAIETRERIESRGNRPLAAIVGYADSVAAHCLGRGEAKTVASNMARAIQQAGWSPDDVDLIYAHGNGTVVFDRIEGQAITQVFGEKGPPVTTNKAQIGHTIAAGGPLSVACAIEVMQRNLAPAVANFRQLDPECGTIDVIAQEPRVGPFKKVLVNSAGLGGQVTTIALESCS